MSEYETIQLKCSKCGKWAMAVLVNNELDEPMEYYLNEDCDAVVVKWDDIQDVDAFITEAENELENANYHGQVALPEKLYRELEEFVKEDKKIDFAKKLAEVFINNI